MTSNINPNNINGAYPVAGQDNNSQGFRDNFTNTSTNFQYAADEITDLQNNAVLKAALAGQTLNNNMNGSILSNAQLQNMSSTVVDLGTLAGTVTINYALGSYQTVTTNGPISLAFSNFHTAGVQTTVVVQITVVSTAHTVQLPTAVSVNALGIQGLDTSTNTITFAATGVYSFAFSTSNGGSTISITDANKEIQPFNNSSEQLNDAGGANLALTTGYFTTVAASTQSLSPGVAGQIKTFAMYGYGGNMVITVGNAGWKSSGSGTMTFSAIGQACTLQYINDKWFCIGNNGVAFA
jgi:uncharacterized surface protein with fasciclin (FAS1) repeats